MMMNKSDSYKDFRTSPFIYRVSLLSTHTLT